MEYLKWYIRMNAQNSIAHPLFINHMKMANLMHRENAIILQFYGVNQAQNILFGSHEFNGSQMNS